jgi:hypothetical protein
LYHVSETKDGGDGHVIESSERKTKTNRKRERQKTNKQTLGNKKDIMNTERKNEKKGQRKKKTNE